MTPDLIQTCGDELYDAWRERRVVTPLLERFPDIRIEDSYAIQSRYVASDVLPFSTTAAP